MLRQARKDGLLTRERFADVMDLDWPQASPPQPGAKWLGVASTALIDTIPATAVARGMRTG
jgi:hypothetical protein